MLALRKLLLVIILFAGLLVANGLLFVGGAGRWMDGLLRSARSLIVRRQSGAQ
jgi:hypothetical protein